MNKNRYEKARRVLDWISGKLLVFRGDLREDIPVIVGVNIYSLLREYISDGCKQCSDHHRVFGAPLVVDTSENSNAVKIGKHRKSVWMP